MLIFMQSCESLHVFQSTGIQKQSCLHNDRSSRNVTVPVAAMMMRGANNVSLDSIGTQNL